jgi:hypothetical protein
MRHGNVRRPGVVRNGDLVSLREIMDLIVSCLLVFPIRAS